MAQKFVHEFCERWFKLKSEKQKLWSVSLGGFKEYSTIPTSWAPTSYTWRYDPNRWPYKWVTGIINCHLVQPYARDCEKIGAASDCEKIGASVQKLLQTNANWIFVYENPVTYGPSNIYTL